MEAKYDQEGFLSKVRGRFGFRKDVALSKWNGNAYVHISDNYNCWETDTFDKTKSKSVTIKWKDAIKLKECLGKLEPYATQIETELQVGLSNEQQRAALNEPFEAETAGPSQTIYSKNLMPVGIAQYLPPGYQKENPATRKKIIYERQGSRYQPY
ncbi:uncharacterized protein LOC123553559 [Mercenaria mercenaria]|uniref:uncharacterized protein LOC123553559 n=1 Tax=Mercenaria mercenaria TaxID=6596 RepID=UPI00234F7E45|nr:uncharacterized protein LOC123553559 [Mercenaria mercenaria]